MDVNAAISMMQGVATTPEQQNMIQWLQTQPKEIVIPFLKQWASQIPLESVPAMLQEQMPHLSPAQHAQIAQSIAQVYNFLSQT